VWTASTGGRERYFIQYHGLDESPEIEISRDIFRLYIAEFNKPMEKRKNEQRRHIERGALDGLIASGKLPSTSPETETEEKADLDSALKLCTATQRRRFELYYFHSYTLNEIDAAFAKIRNICNR
jgi:hypothetical protein